MCFLGKINTADISVPEDPLLCGIMARLIRTYHPERVYLFGSMARGDAGPDSDYDILIIVGDDAAPESVSAGRAYEALWGLRASADVHVWRRSSFDTRLHLKASLPATVVREGRLLYAA
jgi:predicted nucleotidyltransferase